MQPHGYCQVLRHVKRTVLEVIQNLFLFLFLFFSHISIARFVIEHSRDVSEIDKFVCAQNRDLQEQQLRNNTKTKITGHMHSTQGTMHNTTTVVGINTAW